MSNQFHRYTRILVLVKVTKEFWKMTVREIIGCRIIIYIILSVMIEKRFTTVALKHIKEQFRKKKQIEFYIETSP